MRPRCWAVVPTNPLFGRTFGLVPGHICVNMCYIAIIVPKWSLKIKGCGSNPLLLSQRLPRDP